MKIRLSLFRQAFNVGLSFQSTTSNVLRPHTVDFTLKTLFVWKYSNGKLIANYSKLSWIGR